MQCYVLFVTSFCNMFSYFVLCLFVPWSVRTGIRLLKTRRESIEHQTEQVNDKG